uniref:Solute carrier family 4 member 9 n=1 Tax=Otus sunia TaxID=257818 RepID=A0A8C8E8G0_9STRI
RCVQLWVPAGWHGALTPHISPGRWMKFEEKVEDGGERWSAPHIPVLPLQSLFQLRTCLQKGTVLLDLDALSFKEIIDKAISGQPEEAKLQPELRERLAALLLRQPRHQPTKSPLQLLAELSLSPCRGRHSAWPWVATWAATSLGQYPCWPFSCTRILLHCPPSFQLRNRFQKRVPPGAEAAHVVVGEVEFLEKPFTAFIRLRRGVALGSLAEVALPSRFLFILLGPQAKVKAYHEVGRAMATLLTDELFQRVARQAEHREDLITGMEAFLDELTVLPPRKWDPSARIPPPSSGLSQDCRAPVGLAVPQQWGHGSSWRQSQPGVPRLQGGAGEDGQVGGDGSEISLRCPRLFGGLLQDIRRKAPWYGSDFSDALHPQCLAAVLYIYLATVTNAITFGGMLGDATDNMQGVLESFLGTAFAGSIFCLFSGQPLTILGSTGPVLVFERLLFSFSQHHSLDYLEFRLWIGLWVAFFGVVLVATEASHLVRYFTRFTEEGFCALISLIFIYDSLKKMLSLADAFPINWHYRLDNVTSYSCVCNLGWGGPEVSVHDPSLPPALSPQPSAAPAGLSRTQCLGQGGHLLGTSCQYVPDVTLISFLLFGGTFLSCTALKHFRSSRYFPSWPTNPARGWIVFPFGANPWWVCLVSPVPAVLITILIFMDQQITAVILNRREYKLELREHGPLGESHPADPLPSCFAAHPHASAVRGLSAHGGGSAEQHPGEWGPRAAVPHASQAPAGPCLPPPRAPAPGTPLHCHPAAVPGPALGPQVHHGRYYFPSDGMTSLLIRQGWSTSSPGNSPGNGRRRKATARKWVMPWGLCSFTSHPWRCFGAGADPALS